MAVETAVISGLAAAAGYGLWASVRGPDPAALNAGNLFLHLGNFRPVLREVHDVDVVSASAAGAGREAARPGRVWVAEGRIPDDLRGAFVRIGPNPMLPNGAGHHWFDGDGMVHGVTLLDADESTPATGDTSSSLAAAEPPFVRLGFANHWVRTHAFKEQQRIGRQVVPGIGTFIGVRGLAHLASYIALRARGVIRTGPARGPRSDDGSTSNTALVYHDRRLMALVEVAAPFTLRVQEDGSIASGGVHTYDEKLRHPFTAHPKLDPENGYMYFFGYSLLQRPFMSYAVADAAGELVRSFEVPVIGGAPSMAHDMCITERHAVLMDLPVTFRLLSRTLKGGFAFASEERPSRFAVLPLMAKDASEVVWFEAKPCYVFHSLNAWEETTAEGDTEVVVVAIRYDRFHLEFGFGVGPGFTPLPPPRDDDGRGGPADGSGAVGTDTATPAPPPAFRGVRSDHRDANLLTGELYEWRFNLRTRTTREAPLRGAAGVYCEFPVINPRVLGRRNRWGYIALTSDDPGRPTHVVGCAKVDLAAEGEVVGRIDYGPHRYGGEPVFAPRPGAAAEDAGYLLTFVHDEASAGGSARIAPPESADSASSTELWVMDASTMHPTPLCVIKTPQRVPYGFHGLWLSVEQLRAQRALGDRRGPRARGDGKGAKAGVRPSAASAARPPAVDIVRSKL